MIQIRANGDHCDEYGTLTFDGAGCGVSTGTFKCNISTSGAPITETGEFKYEVITPDGEVLISVVVEGGDPCPTGPFEAPAHAQITDKGRILLIDGSTRPVTEDLIFNGVAVEQ